MDLTPQELGQLRIDAVAALDEAQCPVPAIPCDCPQVRGAVCAAGRCETE